METQGSEDEHDVIPKNQLHRNLNAQVTPIAREGTHSHAGKIFALLALKGFPHWNYPLMVERQRGVRSPPKLRCCATWRLNHT